jgi:maleate cis-trans isomerase
MFEEFIPKHRIGFLSPLSVIDNAAYEFYKLAPPGMIAVMIPIGLGEFSVKDVERVFAPIDALLDTLMERKVDMVIQAGTPLPCLIGVEAHDRLIARMAKRTGKPATSTVLAVTRAARHLGIKKIALVNKWSVQMNKTLAEFFAREGIKTGGTATKELPPSEFVKISAGDHMTLAYELGRAAIADNPDCDGVYVGGGTWLAEPVARRLEQESGKFVIDNQTAQMWDILQILKDWKPIPGRNRLLASA